MERLESISDLASARPVWSGLAERAGNIFATWEWADAWWRHFGADRELVLRACLRDDEPYAIAPLYRERRGSIDLLRFIGHGVGDVLGPVCAPAEAGRALETLVGGLRADQPGWTALLAERIPGGPATAALGGELLLSEENPSLAIEGRSWGDYLAGSSKNMREKVRRNTKKLKRDHEVEFELCERPEEVEPMMRTLFDLHGMRWAEGGSFGRDSVAPFHLDFAPVALERGWLRLWTMRIDGEPAAAWYGFRLGGVEAYYQSGRDPRWDRFSVGFLMLAWTIEAAFEDGLDSYGFLRGDESYKSRFATSTGTLESIAVGNGVAGRSAVRAGALALKVPVLRDRIVAIIR